METSPARPGPVSSDPEGVRAEGAAAGMKPRVKFTEDQFILTLAQLAGHPDYQGIDPMAMLNRLHEVVICHGEEIDEPDLSPTPEPLDSS